MSPVEHIGDKVTVLTADHPPRKDSTEYVHTRKWLVGTGQGCIVCGGQPIEDHHGGGWTVAGKLVALNLFPLEWSQGFAADPAVVQAHVAELNVVLKATGEATYDEPITDLAGVMAWVDSPHNASVPICKVHHVGHLTSHTPDAQGHEAVGIHNIPLPIWAGQVTCEWSRFDMWGGSTGTIAVAPTPGPVEDATVLYVSPLHPDKALYDVHQSIRADGGDHVLPPHDPHARLAYAGAHVAA